MTTRLAVVCLALAGLAFGGEATFPLISEDRIPIEEIQVSETAYAAVRKPPGEGPFPAILFLHGGLGQSPMKGLRKNSISMPTQGRFLAWGYVAVTATRRDIRHDPQDRGVVTDTLELVRAVKRLPYVDSGSVALYGGSGGGTLSLEVASVSDELAAIVAGEPAAIIYMGMFNKEHVVLGEQGRPTGDRRQEVMSADPKTLYTDKIRARTRSKLAGLATPTLILHSDQSALKHTNFGVLFPEMEAMGLPVTVSKYQGEPHGFYWGRGRDTAVALRANRDADDFLRKHVRVQPQPVDESWAKPTVVEPMNRPNPN